VKGEDVPEISDSRDTVGSVSVILVSLLPAYIRDLSDSDRLTGLCYVCFTNVPDNEDLKELVYECLYLPWLKGDFLPEFAPEYTGSYLIALQKPSGGIRGIAPVDIWRRATV
jgi:hypothetical protein